MFNVLQTYKFLRVEGNNKERKKDEGQSIEANIIIGEKIVVISIDARSEP